MAFFLLLASYTEIITKLVHPYIAKVATVTSYIHIPIAKATAT